MHHLKSNMSGTTHVHTSCPTSWVPRNRDGSDATGDAAQDWCFYEQANPTMLSNSCAPIAPLYGCNVSTETLTEARIHATACGVTDWPGVVLSPQELNYNLGCPLAVAATGPSATAANHTVQYVTNGTSGTNFKRSQHAI